MSFFVRLRRSQAGFFASLLAVVWLSLVPLVQIVPVVDDETGQPDKFVICTSLGIKLDNRRNSSDHTDTNNDPQLISCVICNSQQIQSGMALPGLADSINDMRNPGQLASVASLIAGVLPACHLPESRAPPLA